MSPLFVVLCLVLGAVALDPTSPYRSFNPQEGKRVVARSVEPGELAFDVVGENYQLGPNDWAWARYTDMNTTGNGFSLFEVHLNPSCQCTDAQGSYAAGYLEGQLTALPLYQLYVNTQPATGVDDLVLAWLADNDAWMYQQISSNPNDPYWNQVNLALEQLGGLEDGYNSVCSLFNGCSLASIDFLLLTASDDIGDIINAVHQQPSNANREGRGHCSSLIKLLADGSDLYSSHVTWSEFNGMIRTYKLYDLPFRLNPTQETKEGGANVVPGASMSFSSYPGTLLSGDDFYQISSGLVVIETTIGYNNESLASFVVPQTVLEWIRNMVANRLATDGESWSQIFARYNSGTYNNEWMIVNYNLFTPGQPLQPGTLFVMDQLPGPYVQWQDKTPWLAQNSYWASYNVISFPGLFNVSESYIDVQKFGDWFTWDKCPRANIFRRDQDKVTDLDAMQAIMRYNDFTHDPLSRCNCTPPYSGENAIASRSDLNPANGVYPFGALGRRAHGATDAKITSFAMNQEMTARVIMGPTDDQQPAFDWRTANFPQLSHIGMPDLFEFGWFELSWPSRPNN